MQRCRTGVRQNARMPVPLEAASVPVGALAIAIGAEDVALTAALGVTPIAKLTKEVMMASWLKFTARKGGGAIHLNLEGSGWRSSASDVIELGHRDVLIVVVALVMVALLFEPLGAYITLGLFGTALLVLIARIPVLLAVMAAALGVLLCWCFFHALLGLRLPTGPL